MSDIQTITKLRKMTGAGMVDCKKALDEAGDDMDKAVEILRKKGETKAAKKADDNNLSVRSVERIIERYAKLMIPILKINPQILRNTLAHTLKLEGAQKENIRTSLHFKTKTGADNYLKKI